MCLPRISTHSFFRKPFFFLPHEMMLKGRSKINCGQVDKLVRGLGDGGGGWIFFRV